MGLLVVSVLVVCVHVAASVPVVRDCSLHQHVEDLYNVRYGNRCDQRFNGQLLSPALCTAGSLVSHMAERTGCTLSFAITIGPGQSITGGHLAIYKLPDLPQSPPSLTPTPLVVTASLPYKERTITSEPAPSAASGGWQLFPVDGVLQGLPQGTHNVTVRLALLNREETTCSEVIRTYLLEPTDLDVTPEDLGCHTDRTPLLTAYADAAGAWLAPPFPPQKAVMRRDVRAMARHDYVRQLFAGMRSFKVAECNATFNGQVVSPYLCHTDHVKFLESNNSCTSHSCLTSFNVSLADERVMGAQVVLYLNRTANTTTTLLVQLYGKNNTLVSQRYVPPSSDGWQLLDVEHSVVDGWSNDAWTVESFEVRVSRVRGGEGGGGEGASNSSAEPVDPFEVSEWIEMGDGEGTGGDSDVHFVPIMTVYADFISTCHLPWPWQCPNGPLALGRKRSASMLGGGLQMVQRGSTSVRSSECHAEDRWVPASRLFPPPQTVRSATTPLYNVVVLPRNLNVRQCGNQCPGHLAPQQQEARGGGGGLGTCCTPAAYKGAHLVVRGSDGSYLTTYLDSAVIDQCRKAS